MYGCYGPILPVLIPSLSTPLPHHLGPRAVYKIRTTQEVFTHAMALNLHSLSARRAVSLSFYR